MSKTKLIQSIRKIYKQGTYLLLAAVVVLATSPSVFAAPTFSNYAISSSYTNISGVTTADGSLWYVEYNNNIAYIGRMTTAGVTTDYDIRTLSGLSALNVRTLTTGPDGNIWFNANSGNTVYSGQLDVLTGLVTVYGAWIPSYGDIGAIVTGSDGNLWYYIKSANDNKHHIIYVNPSTGAVNTAYTSDTYSNFTSITSGPDGNIWITDSYYNLVLALNATGLVYTYTVPTANSSPASIASGPDGNVWFVEWSNKKIVKLTTSGVFTEYSPSVGVAAGRFVAGPDGAMWFVDSGVTKKIGRITSSGVMTEYTVPGINVSSVNGMTLGPDNKMWFSYIDSGDAKLGNVTTAPFLDNYAISSSNTTPLQITTAGGSSWYVQTNSVGNNTIGSMTTSGVATDYVIMPLGASYMRISDLTTGPDGNVWFVGCSSSNATGWTVQAGRIDVSTGVTTFYTNTSLGAALPCSAASGSLPGTITTGPDGNLWYVVNRVILPTSKTTYLYSLNPSTGATTTSWSGNSGTYAFMGMVTGPDGKLWATNNTATYSHHIHKFTISASHYASLSTTYSTGNSPAEIIVGPDGNLWFTGGTYNVSKITTSGVLTQYSLDPSHPARSLAVGPDGAIWFTTSSTNGTPTMIVRITTSGIITQYPVTGGPYGITLGSDGALWFTRTGAISPGVYSLGRLGY